MTPSEIVAYSLWIGIPIVIISCIYIGIYCWRNAFIKPTKSQEGKDEK